MMRVLGRHIKALERQLQKSVLIEKLAEKEEECLNLKSEWAGTKIPGLRVNNPKGLGSGKVGDDTEEGKGLQEGRDLYMEAIKRGTKRLMYKKVPAQEQEEQEESLGPKLKKARNSGEFGQGWEHLTKERSPDPGGKDPGQCSSIDLKPKTFSDLLARSKQKDIRTMFTKIETETELRLKL